MKKIFYLASIAALAFSSCAKDETTEAQINAVNGGSKITAAVEADATRTHLEEVDGNYEFRWSKNDILGVYGDGENSAPNVAFTLLDSSIDQAAGVFESDYKLLDGKNYVAYYPYQPGSDMVPAWDKGVLDPSTIKLSIPASQNYKPSSFNTLTAPAVSDSFVMDEDGNADVTMQPVADYLFVNMMSTEDIQKLTLKLWHDQTGWVNIAGEGTLKPYTIKDTKTTRYFLSNDGMDKAEIVLNSGQLTDAVCHEPNVYVFVVPAGILGTNQPISARIIVNKDAVESDDVEGVDYFHVTGTQLNGGVSGKTNLFREYDATTGVATRRLENTIFWANALDKNGERTSFLYNPDEVFIIQNEVDFLKYMNEYEDEDSEECYGKDAFVCSEYVFDFSEENMGELATEVEEEYLREYISDYLANGMPCIYTYANNFRGNGATLKAITKLQSWFGLFGDIEGTINELTIEDIEAAEDHPIFTRATSNLEAFSAGLSVLLGEGVILGSVTTDNKNANNINNVTVKNAWGGAVFADATVAAFNGVTFDGVSGLDFAAFQLKQNADLDMTKTWDSVKDVCQNIFGGVYAVKDAKGDGHHVITIAKGGAEEYEQLAAIIHVEGTGMDIEYVINAIIRNIENYPDVPLAYIVAGLADSCEASDEAGYAGWEDDDLATSVVIEGVSYWTGDYIEPTYDDKAKNYPIAYAEQLAIGLPNFTAPVGSVFVLQNDINFNFENNFTLWEMANIGNYNTLDGNDKTISGFVMEVYVVSEVAPFSYAMEIKDLTVNGVDINIETDDTNSKAVPAYIAGLVNNTNVLTNVVVNDINFDAYDVSGGFNSEDDPYYAPNRQPVIGWVASYIQDSANVGAKVVDVKANVTSSNLKGISGLIGHLDLAHVTEAYFEDCALTSNIAQEAIEEFTPVISLSSNPVDAAGTMVAFVYNTRGVRSIKFNGCGAPVFFYNAGNADDDNKINVLYNDKKVETLLGVEE